MSAESPIRSRSQTRAGGPSTVSPQPFTDPTILDSVAGFINEVVPTAYGGAPCEIDDTVQWAHFEQLEDGVEGSAMPPPLLLVLGYNNGIQIWAIPATGEATDILSWRHSSFRVLRLIPTPYKTSCTENVDCFASARPLIALCDSMANYSSLTFRSLKAGVVNPVKQIQFQSAISNVLANRRSVVVSFTEKIAVFDAFTLEPRVSITTCYLSPGIQPNPIALGDRWLAYAEKKFINTSRSGGGNDGEGTQSYTATVLHAAKSLGRGLKEFTETVAVSLTGNPGFRPGTSPNSPQAGGLSDVPQKGVITILDIENKSMNPQDNAIPQDAVIAHFVAHTEAVVCMSFDPSGMLLLTADKRGHDFHVFRIQPHPAGSALAAVHHLYSLHRGDTTAKVQDMCFSPDSRWVTVSTLRGTTHVFPVTPYGGNISVRTHYTPLVVNKISRYQRSAGLNSEGRSSSPVGQIETPVGSSFPYRNPRFSPYPQPTVVNALAQIRQPVYVPASGTGTHSGLGRQRLPSSSEDNILLRVVACFAAPRAWMDSTKSPRETTHKEPVRSVDSLFVMSCYGTLVQYDLEPHPAGSVPKERVCNDTAIDLKVCPRAQWVLHRQPNAADVPLPMSEQNLAYVAHSLPLYRKNKATDKEKKNDDWWMPAVEIVTHLGPHRRLWMGPQFTFKTYTITNGAVVESRPIDVGRSKPVNMPVSKANAVMIESGSASSCEQFFLDTYHKASDETGSAGELQLREDLADAMMESPGIREQGGHCVLVSMKPHTTTKVVNPLGTVVTVQSDDKHPEMEVIEDAVIHENCDEALFRPVVVPKAVFYAGGNKPKPCPPGNILTKSLEANTGVAVRIINRKEAKNNTNKTSLSSKHIIASRPKSRESSPKPIKTKTKSDNKAMSKSNKSELNILESKNNKPSNKSNRTKNETNVCEFSDAFIFPTTTNTTTITTDHSIRISSLDDFDILSLQTVPEKPGADSFTCDFVDSGDNFASPPVDKFEDAEDCNERPTSDGTPNKAESETPPNSAEEDKPYTKKARKPKAKLGVKIASKDKPKSLAEVPADVPPQPKTSWNVIAASKPAAVEKAPDTDNTLDVDCAESFTFRLPPKDNAKENLIDIDVESEIAPEDINEVTSKIDKLLSDDEKPDGSSTAETTTESDDSSKIPAIADDGGLSSAQTMQTSTKSAKKKATKKKRR